MNFDPASGPDEKSQGTTETPRDASSFIAEVSHELRLPIANLRLLVETLLDVASEDPEALKRMLTRAHQEVERLQKLVEDLLSVGEVSSPRQELRCQWVQLEERARYSCESVKSLAKAQGVKVVLDIKPDWQVYANPDQLDQVLLNLVENAVKFTPADGSVTIRSGSQPGSFLVIDSGIGMAASEIPKIFQRFYRIDRARSRGSTGLGLSIVKHIADLHGAKISVLSEEGRGSTFQLHFPDPRPPHQEGKEAL